MFALTMGTGMNFAFPDVCQTPIPPVIVPIPYPNISETATATPAAYNVLMDCMPTLNQMSFPLVSEGDETGVAMGVASFFESGTTMYLLGNVTIFAFGTPVQRLTSITAQNCLVVLPNTVGMTICPSQVTVLTLG